MYLSKMHKYATSRNTRSFSQILKAFATVDPANLGSHSKGYNLVSGEWKTTAKERQIIDPMTGKTMLV